MTILKKITDGLSRLEGILAGSLLAIIVLINFVEIVQRNLLKLSFPWVQELSLILISWVVFFGAAYIYKKETLLRVDFLYLKAKGAVRLCWEMLWHILECAVLVILTIYGCRYAQSQSTGVTYSLGINRAAYSIPMIYCAASMLIGMIEKIYDSGVSYRQGKKEAA